MGINFFLEKKSLKITKCGSFFEKESAGSITGRIQSEGSYKYREYGKYNYENWPKVHEKLKNGTLTRK